MSLAVDITRSRSAVHPMSMTAPDIVNLTVLKVCTHGKKSMTGRYKNTHLRGRKNIESAFRESPGTKHPLVK